MKIAVSNLGLGIGCHFNPEDGGDDFIRNVGNNLQEDYTVSQPWAPQSASSSPWEPQNSDMLDILTEVASHFPKYLLPNSVVVFKK